MQYRSQPENKAMFYYSIAHVLSFYIERKYLKKVLYVIAFHANITSISSSTKQLNVCSESG